MNKDVDSANDLQARLEHVQNKLAEAEAKLAFLSGILTALHDTFVLVIGPDAVCRVAWVDPELAARTGLDTSEIAGTRLFDDLPADVRSYRMQQLRLVFETGRPVRDEYSIQLPGGEFWHDISMAPLRDADGAVTAALAIIRDVTDRKLTEIALRESEERYRCVCEHAESFVVIEQDGQVVFANEAARRAAKAAGLDAVIGGRTVDFASPTARQRIRERAASVAESTAAPAMLEEELLGADGKPFPAQVAAQRIAYGGRPATLLVVRDITDRKHAEEERRQLESSIERAQKLESLAALASGVAHDFNNLLAMVLGSASLARARAERGPELEARLRSIETAAERARELVQQLHVYAGNATITRRPVLLSSLVRETAELLSGSGAGHVPIERACEAPLPVVEADATQLRQVIMNLFLNATEAMDGRSGSIQVDLRPMQADRTLLTQSVVDDHLSEGLYVCLEVRDSGCGIEPAALPRIFHSSFSTKSTGRGHGLAAVLAIVRSHHGAIRVQSAPGRGTVFQVLLPATLPTSYSPTEPRGATASESSTKPGTQ